jgi:hypothetical protein
MRYQHEQFGNFMKVKTYSDGSFFAKMVLLLALVFLGQAEKRKGLESYLKNIFKIDSVTVGQVPSSKIIASPQLQATIKP